MVIAVTQFFFTINHIKILRNSKKFIYYALFYGTVPMSALDVS